MHDPRIPGPKFKTLEEMKAAYEKQPAQAGTGEIQKGRQTFFVPICSRCGDFSSRKYGNQVVAWERAVSHIKEDHAKAQ